MNNEIFKDTNDEVSDEINFEVIFEKLWSKKLAIMIFTSIIALITLIYSLMLPNIYFSSATLAPASNNNNLSNLASKYSGVASLAGISLPSSGDSNKVAEGIEIAKSLNFFENLSKRNNLFFKLVAHRGWDKETNMPIIDEDVYNIKKKKWVSNEKFSVNGVPSIQSAHKLFLENFQVSTNKENGFITISMRHYSPYIAKEFLEIIIHEINELSRNDDISISQNTILYLEAELANTKINGVRSGINELIEKQIEMISLAKGSPHYLFKVLSEPYAPEENSDPKRLIIVIFSSLISFFFICTYILLQGNSKEY